MKKIYVHENITYGFNVAIKSWEFKAGSFSYLARLRGKMQADKIAAIVSGAVKRTGAVDGLARSAISRVTA